MEAEIWKAHPEYAGIEVSSFGRVRSVNGYYYKGIPNKDGYLQVKFYVNGKRVDKLAHRLVAQTFIPNQDNFPQVNHKNCDRADNRVINLEWCSRSYNQMYREKYGEALGKPMLAVNLKTKEVFQFRSQAEASRVLRVYRSSINGVISGSRKQAGGYWFVNDDGHAVDIVKNNLHDIGKTGLKI